MSTMRRGRLRIGIALGSAIGPRWVGDLLGRLAASEDNELVVLALPAEPRRSRRRGFADVPLWLYRRLDARLFGQPDDPTVSIDLFKAVPILGEVAGDARAEGTVISPASTDRGDLDLIIALAGADHLGHRSLESAHGTWSFRQTSLSCQPDPSDATSGTHRQDVLARAPVTVTDLVKTQPELGSVVIGRVVSSTDRLSSRRGGRNHYPKVGWLIDGALRDLRLDGKVRALDDCLGVAAVSAPRSTVAILVALGLLVSGFIGRRLRDTVAPERWIIAVHRDNDGTVHQDEDPDDLIQEPHRRPFQALSPPKGLGWADPFPVVTPEGAFLFVEEWVRAERRGRIAVLRQEGQDRWSAAETALALDSHLSFPFVFDWEGSWYLMPEQNARGSLELYRAVQFPTEWRWDRTLLQVGATDANLAEVDGRWWLFAALRGPGGTVADQLHIYSAPTPLGPWRAHLRNPVVSDVRTARPAGRLFQRGDAWYRVAQDGGPTYGHSIVLLQIDRLDDDAYREHIVGRILPTWRPGMHGTHTLNQAGDITVVDAHVRERRVWELGRTRGRARTAGRARGGD